MAMFRQESLEPELSCLELTALPTEPQRYISIKNWKNKQEITWNVFIYTFVDKISCADF